MTKRDEKAKLLIELEKVPIVQVACTRSGIARSTYYRWREEDPAFRERVNTALRRGRGRINDLAESSLIRFVKDGNLSATIFWLKSNFASQYAPKTAPLNSLSEEEEAELDRETEELRAMLEDIEKEANKKPPHRKKKSPTKKN